MTTGRLLKGIKMRYGLAYNGMYSIGQILDVARAADGTAVEGIWLAEHLGYRDAFVPAGAILSATEHLTVSPTSASPYARNAMLTAMQTASLAELAPGRVALGLGAGNPMAYRESGMALERPLTAMREYIHLIKALWSGERVWWEGKVYRMDGATFQVPVSPTPPIELAAMREGMLALAGETCERIVTSAGLTPEAIRSALGTANEAVTGAGRPPGSLVTVGFVYTSVSVDRAEAVEKARRGLAYLFRSGFVAERLRDSGINLDIEALTEAASRRDWETAMSFVSDEAVEACAVAGTPAECRPMMDRYADTGLDILVMVPPTGAQDGRLALEMARDL